MYGRYFEDLVVGRIYKHSITKTITESDNNLFCLLTLNHHPLHNDRCYAAETDHGDIVVVGTYVLSLVVGISVADISGMAIANLDYESIKHHSPVRVGATIHAETEVLEKRQSESKHDRGIVYVETRAYNHWGDKVLTLRRHILLPRKPKDPIKLVSEGI
jgi:acyl dehydratase